eukprot:jgi/Botrbrau1/21590/Bobra.0426s0001.1
MTLGGIIPFLLAYSRELRERAAFLRKCRVTILKPTLGSYVHDGLLACSVVIMSMGCLSALYMGFPELYDVPMKILEGQV